MTIRDVLNLEIEQLGTIRLPVRESATIQVIEHVMHDLEECVKAIEQAEQEKPKPEPTVVEEPAEEN